MGTQREDGDSLISDEEIQTFRRHPRQYFLFQDHKRSAIQVLWLVLWTTVVFGIGVAASRALFQEHRERVFSMYDTITIPFQHSSQ